MRERVVATSKAALLIINQHSFDERAYFESLRAPVDSLAVTTPISASEFSLTYMISSGIGLLGSEGERYLEDISADDTDTLRKNTTLFGKADTGGNPLLRLIGEFRFLAS